MHVAAFDPAAGQRLSEELGVSGFSGAVWALNNDVSSVQLFQKHLPTLVYRLSATVYTISI